MNCSVACVFLCLQSLVGFGDPPPAWGFFGHRLINEKAVYTLPPQMMPLYKTHLAYLRKHSVDPDIRRHAVPLEAENHYIDIDHWGANAFDVVPRDYILAVLKYSNIEINDSLENRVIHNPPILDLSTARLSDRQLLELKGFFTYIFYDNYIEPTWEVPMDPKLADVLQIPYRENANILITDKFREFGIGPYHLESKYYRLVDAFRDRNAERILRESAEIGHYMSDLCVPLHTTENYNGQLTGQDGIHAFWESRIPELFAEDTYDFYVGKAEFISNVNVFIWNTVENTYSYVAELLQKEKELKSAFPSNQIYCFDIRLEKTVRTECREFAAAYQTALNGNVELQMKKAIHKTASLWYSAWVDAGRPDLNDLDAQLDERAIEIENTEHTERIQDQNK